MEASRQTQKFVLMEEEAKSSSRARPYFISTEPLSHRILLARDFCVFQNTAIGRRAFLSAVCIPFLPGRLYIPKYVNNVR